MGKLAALLAIIGVCMVCAIAGVIVRVVQGAEQEQARLQQVEAQRTAERHRALRDEIPGAIARIKEGISRASAKLEAREYDEAVAAIQADTTLVNQYRELSGQPAELVAALDEWTRISSVIRPIANVRGACETARRNMAQAARLRRDPIEAERLYVEAGSSLAGIAATPEDARRAAHCPSPEDAARGRARVAPLAERERTRLAEIRARCGTAPMISSWDGELVGAESVLEEGAYDADSIDVEHCSEPALDARTCWQTDCIVKGKNAFGMNVMNMYRFNVANGVIVRARRL